MKTAPRWMSFASGLVTIVMMPAISGAATPDAIAGRSGCSACHSVDKKKLGPSYRDIAARYKGSPKAPAFLTAKVRSGGGGVWGAVPMPAADAKKIGDADLGAVIAWILKQ